MVYSSPHDWSVHWCPLYLSAFRFFFLFLCLLMFCMARLTRKAPADAFRCWWGRTCQIVNTHFCCHNHMSLPRARIRVGHGCILSLGPMCEMRHGWIGSCSDDVGCAAKPFAWHSHAAHLHLHLHLHLTPTPTPFTPTQPLVLGPAKSNTRRATSKPKD